MPLGAPVAGVSNLVDCLRSCVRMVGFACDAVLWQPAVEQCYRKRNIRLDDCWSDDQFVLYQRTDPYSPSPPPSPPPVPPKPSLPPPPPPPPSPPFPPRPAPPPLTPQPTLPTAPSSPPSTSPLFPPFEPPYPPPPPSRWLNADQCSAFWQDPNHRFHDIFGAKGWEVRFRGQAACWEDFDAFWISVKKGDVCSRNWYTGNPGNLGAVYGGPTKPFSEPHFTAKTAPALLGFDENIDDYCLEHGNGWGGHAERCVRANVNILSLYGDEIPYNVCRNVEWQTCAAMGSLPGQGEGRGGNVLRFAKAPRNLQPHKGDRVIGGCYGYHPGAASPPLLLSCFSHLLLSPPPITSSSDSS